MAIVKEILGFAMFGCMFAVLLLFVELQSELRENLATSEFSQAASIKVIASNTEIIVSKDGKIKMLRAEITEMREIIMVLQNDNEDLKARIKIVEELNDLKDKLIEELNGKAC